MDRKELIGGAQRIFRVVKLFSDTIMVDTCHYAFVKIPNVQYPHPVFLPGESQGRGEPRELPSMGSHRVRHD